MLSFKPPFQVVGGFPVFADHEDRDLFHMLPDQPRLVQDAAGLPKFELVRYLGDTAGGGALSGGFLTLTASLAIPDPARAAVRAALKVSVGRTIRVQNALFDEGSVDLVLLGQTSGGPQSDGSPFKVTMLGSGLPSMAGDNTIAFQVALDAQAAAFVEGALGLPGLPALLLYRMALSGLQPAFGVRISGDWSKLHEELQSRFRANVYYVRADVEADIRKSATSAGVKVDTTVFDGDAAEQAAQAERQMIDWITDNFFDPAYGAKPPQAPSLVNEIKTSILDVVDTLMPGASFKLKTLREEDVRSIEARIDRTTARRRDLVFQASLGATLEGLRVDENGNERADWPVTKARLVGGLNVAAIPRREVTLGCVDRFASDGVALVEIDIALPDPDGGADLNPRTEVFDDAAQRARYVVNLMGAPPEMLTQPYRYRLRVHYDPSSAFGQEPVGEAPWVDGRSSELIVDPRVHGPYRLRSPQIGVAPGFPFAQFPQVLVETSRVEDDGREEQIGNLVLTPAQPLIRWTFRGHGASAERFRFRVTYDRPTDQGGPVLRDWQETSTTLLTLPDPLPHRRRASFFTNLPWAEIAIAFLEVRYSDPANGVEINERINLAATVPFVERDYAIADPAVQALRFRLTAFLPLRGLVQGDWRESLESTFVIGRELFEMRAIRFRAIGLPIESRQLGSLRLKAEVLDPGDRKLFETLIEVGTGQGGSDLGTWTFPRAGTEAARLRIRADWRDENGFADSSGWQALTRDLVVFSLPALGFVG
jgi:hypothetical protein